MTPAPKRNWSRFLHRLWFVATVLWVAVVAVNGFYVEAYPFGPTTADRDLARIRAGDSHKRALKEAVEEEGALLRHKASLRPQPTPGSDDVLHFFTIDGKPVSALIGDRELERLRSARIAKEIAKVEMQAWARFVVRAAWALGLPLLVLAVGHAIAWAIQGLRPSNG